MLKRIPKSDISIRPFKAYKEWDKETSNLSIFSAEDGNYASIDETTSSVGYLIGSSYNKHSIYGQLRAQFYNGDEDNPFIRFGSKKPIYSKQVNTNERYLSGSAIVISIPQNKIGDGIKKGSVLLYNDDLTYFDDEYGNLYDVRDKLLLSKLSVNDSVIQFDDLAEYGYSGSVEELLGDFDVQAKTLNITYDGISYDLIVDSIDIANGYVVAKNIPFLPEESQGIKVGNIFYSQGLIVVTRQSVTSDAIDISGNNWDMTYKSTETIYEHEYLLIANEDEFNVSTNPTAIVEVGKETGLVTGSDGRIYKTTTSPGVKYIKKKSTLENGNILDYRIPSQYTASISGGFEHYDMSGSVDTTGSFLSPFITTIGLYDDNCDLVAVAKLPQPIKSEPDIPVNFIVRFDT
jgi:hypothetical protein